MVATNRSLLQLVLVPDKFKGSLTAAEVCQIVARGVRRYDPTIQIHSIPLADGGEGTLDILIPLLELDTVRITVHDPLFRPIMAYYGVKEDEAYVEMAVASGLPLLKESERNPLHTTSLGAGELVRHAVEHGARRVYLFVGGSATNDAGIGMAQRWATDFWMHKGRSCLRWGETWCGWPGLRPTKSCRVWPMWKFGW